MKNPTRGPFEGGYSRFANADIRACGAYSTKAPGFYCIKSLSKRVTKSTTSVYKSAKPRRHPRKRVGEQLTEELNHEIATGLKDTTNSVRFIRNFPIDYYERSLFQTKYGVNSGRYRICHQAIKDLGLLSARLLTNGNHCVIEDNSFQLKFSVDRSKSIQDLNKNCHTFRKFNRLNIKFNVLIREDLSAEQQEQLNRFNA